MTTIKITDGHAPDDHVVVHISTSPPDPDLARRAAERPRRSFMPPTTSPISLVVNDDPRRESALVWLSPSKAREVIAALQAVVDEVEPPTDADVERLAQHLFGVARSPWTWATRNDSVKVEWRQAAREALRMGAVLPPRER